MVDKRQSKKGLFSELPCPLGPGWAQPMVGTGKKEESMRTGEDGCFFPALCLRGLGSSSSCRALARPGAHPLQLHSALGASGGIAEDATSTPTDHAQPWGFPVQELRDPLGSTWRHGWLRASSAQTEP